MSANPAQIKIIHTLKSLLRIEEEDYRAMLRGYGPGVSSSTSQAFTIAMAADLITKLQLMAGRDQPTRAVPSRPKKYDELGDRPGMASPAQLRKIEVMWANISRQPDAASRAVALRRFLKNITGIEDITWLETSPTNHVSKVLRALSVMTRNSKRSEHEPVVG